MLKFIYCLSDDTLQVTKPKWLDLNLAVPLVKQNVNWNYLVLNEAFNILNYVGYMGVSLLHADRISQNLLDFLFFALYFNLFSYTAHRKNVMVTFSHLR